MKLTIQNLKNEIVELTYMLKIGVISFAEYNSNTRRIYREIELCGGVA